MKEWCGCCGPAVLGDRCIGGLLLCIGEYAGLWIFWVYSRFRVYCSKEQNVACIRMFIAMTIERLVRSNIPFAYAGARFEDLVWTCFGANNPSSDGPGHHLQQNPIYRSNCLCNPLAFELFYPRIGTPEEFSSPIGVSPPVSARNIEQKPKNGLESYLFNKNLPPWQSVGVRPSRRRARR